MARITLDVNGSAHTIDADPGMPLLYALRNDLGLNNPHFGCGLAQCGACTVHINGEAVRSCVTPLSAVGNGKVVTLAGLGTPEKRCSTATRSRPMRRSRTRSRGSNAAAAPTWASCVQSSARPR